VPVLFPGGTWSHTLGLDLDACLRRVYYRVYGSWGGWNLKNGPEARMAYTAKQSGTLAMHAGTLVHETIQVLLQNGREGRWWPEEKLITRIRQRFLDDVAYSEQRAWKDLRTPKDATFILNEHLAGCDVSPEQVELFANRAATCLQAFLSDHLPALRVLGPQNWLQIDSLDSVRHDGFELFMVPDLVTRPTEASPERTIIDWKTGAHPDVDQLAVYALYLVLKAQATGRTPPTPEQIVGRSIPLLDTSAVAEKRMTQADLDRAMARIEVDLTKLKPLQNPGERKDIALFPKTPDRGRCQGCVHRFYCDMED